MSENVMKTIYIIRVYDKEWDEWNDIYAVSSREDALDEYSRLRDKGEIVNFYPMQLKE